MTNKWLKKPVKKKFCCVNMRIVAEADDGWRSVEFFEDGTPAIWIGSYAAGMRGRVEINNCPFCGALLR